MTRACDVAIVGGGIGGLTLAASLAQRSVSVQVFEQDTELREIGAGIAVGGNATRLLARLGIDLVPVASRPAALGLRRWRDGTLLGSHPIGEWYREEVGAQFLTLHRATLQRLLAAAVPPGASGWAVGWPASARRPPACACVSRRARMSWRASPSAPTASIRRRAAMSAGTWRRPIPVRSAFVA